MTNNFPNSNNLFIVSDSQNDIEFAVAQITKRLEELNKAEALGKSLIVPHKHQGSMSAGAAVDDVPPSKVNPPGMDKEEKKMSTKCAKCGELWKDEAEKCFKCGHLEKCGEMQPPLKKASLVYAPGGPLQIQGMNPKAEMPPATGKDISEPFAAEGSGGQIKKGSVKSLRNKASKMAKADVPMAKPPAPKAAPSAPAMSAKPSTMVKEEHQPKGIFKRLKSKLGKTTLQDVEPDGSISKEKQVSKTDFWSPEASADEKINPPKGGAKPKAAEAPMEAPKPKFTGADLAAAKAKLSNANVKPNRPGIFGKLAKRNKQ